MAGMEQLVGAVQGLEIEGIPEMRRALDALAYGVQRRVIRTAGRAAIRPVVRAAKQEARQLGIGKETRVAKQARKAEGRYRLWETFSAISRTYPASGTFMMVAGPIYGPKYGHKGNIGHLVELGHEKILWGKRVGGRVAGRHILKRAWDSQRDVVLGVLRTKVRAGIEAETRKARQLSWLGQLLGGAE